MLSPLFTGKAKGTTISLPDDMWEYLRLRAAREDRKLSTIVRRALEKDIMDRAEQRLVDPSVEYEVRRD